MSHGRFQKMGKSGKRMYGPRVLVVCGCPVEDQEPLLRFLGDTQLGSIPVLFVTDGDGDRTLKEILAYPDRTGLDQPSNLRRAMIACGFTQKELHRLLAAYRTSVLPSPLWATLTPTSENWTVRRLLEELAAESEAMKRKGKRP